MPIEAAPGWGSRCSCRSADHCWGAIRAVGRSSWGSLNLGGSIESIPNPVRIAELAVDKQASTLLMPVAARRLLNDLPDDLWTKISIEFYKDSADAVFKALVE
jgi:predicted ATP-dependent Lon-type protease